MQDGARPSADETQRAIFQGYAEDAADLIDRFNAVDPGALLAPVRSYLPTGAARILDIGAGAGGTAIWLARRGASVTAVEPVDAFRAAATARDGGSEVIWHAGALPDLPDVTGPFDLVLLSAVWHHIDPRLRDASLRRLADLLAPRGQLVLSLRSGPYAPHRPGFVQSPVALAAAAKRCGLFLAKEVGAPSLQAANRKDGVNWVWCILRRDL